HRHVYGEQWIKFIKDGVNATPLPTVNTTGYIDHAAFLGTINPDTNKIPKHLFQGYLNIYNNYFKAPWMPDRKIGRAVQQECRDRSRMPSSARKKKQTLLISASSAGSRICLSYAINSTLSCISLSTECTSSFDEGPVWTGLSLSLLLAFCTIHHC